LRLPTVTMDILLFLFDITHNLMFLFDEVFNYEHHTIISNNCITK